MTPYRRAVAQRALLIFALVGFVLLMTALAPGYKPWPLLVGVFVPFGLIMLVVSTRADRKLQLQAGKHDAAWDGANAATMPVQAPVQRERALEIARETLVQLPARDVQTVDDHMAVGWVGSMMFANLPRLQAYEVAIVIEHHAEETQFLCCARPRISYYFGGAMSQEWASRLRQALLAHF